MLLKMLTRLPRTVVVAELRIGRFLYRNLYRLSDFIREPMLLHCLLAETTIKCCFKRSAGTLYQLSAWCRDNSRQSAKQTQAALI